MLYLETGMDSTAVVCDLESKYRKTKKASVPIERAFKGSVSTMTDEMSKLKNTAVFFIETNLIIQS